VTTLDFTLLGDPDPVIPPIVFHPPVKRTAMSGTAKLLISVGAYAGLGVIAIFFGRITFDSIVRSSEGKAPTWAFALPLLGMLVFAGATALLATIQIRRSLARDRLREPSIIDDLAPFAVANNLTYLAVTEDPTYPGSMFTVQNAKEKRLTNHLQPTSGREFDIGTFEYIVAEDSQRVRHAYGYVAVRLDHTLPNMVLSSIANRKKYANELPTIDASQTYRLEGDFNEYFRLYCPRGYEVDALYFFAPDLMELLVDEVGDFDVELVDDWLFVYSPQPFDGVHLWERLFRIIDVVGAKAAKQGEHYVDDRSATPATIAPAGARLVERPSALLALEVVGGILLCFALYAIWSLLLLAFPAGAPL
jgi:hypothetical protein